MRWRVGTVMLWIAIVALAIMVVIQERKRSDLAARLKVAEMRRAATQAALESTHKTLEHLIAENHRLFDENKALALEAYKAVKAFLPPVDESLMPPLPMPEP